LHIFTRFREQDCCPLKRRALVYNECKKKRGVTENTKRPNKTVRDRLWRVRLRL